MAGGRWVTQIWLGPFPILDLIFQFSILVAFFSFLRVEKDFESYAFGAQLILFALSIFYVFTVFRVIYDVLTEGYEINLIFRDSTFFLSLGSIPIITKLLKKEIHNLNVQSAISKSLTGASIVAIACAVLSRGASDFNGWQIHVPILDLQAPLLSVRSDQLICGISPLMIYLFHNISKDRKKNFSRLGLAVIYIFVLTQMSSRAVLLAALIITLIGVSSLRRQNTNSGKGNTFALPILIFLTPFAFFNLNRIPSIQRFLSGFGLSPLSSASTSLEIGSAGTQHAREEAWKLIWNFWIGHEFWMGFPFGYHFVLESGALRYLSGAADVRWPHNVLLSILCRSGLILGVVLIFAIIGILIAAILGTRHPNADLIDLQVLALVSTIITVSCFGVLLESPFGYIPFTFASAVIMSRTIMLKRFKERYYK